LTSFGLKELTFLFLDIIDDITSKIVDIVTAAIAAAIPALSSAVIATMTPHLKRSGQSSRNSQQSNGSNSGVSTPSSVFPPIPEFSLPVPCNFNVTYSAQKSSNEYFQQLKENFDPANDGNIWEHQLTRNSFRVLKNRDAILRLYNTAVNVRNVYLELYDCNFIATDWISRRNAQEFDTKDYSSTSSPQHY
jgi:hypothetical protein